MPNNCNECEYTKTCQRYYGARGSRYEKEITKAILEKHEREERKRQYEEKD